MIWMDPVNGYTFICIRVQLFVSVCAGWECRNRCLRSEQAKKDYCPGLRNEGTSCCAKSAVKVSQCTERLWSLHVSEALQLLRNTAGSRSVSELKYLLGWLHMWHTYRLVTSSCQSCPFLFVFFHFGLCIFPQLVLYELLRSLSEADVAKHLIQQVAVTISKY